LVYNEFPLMGDGFLPHAYNHLSPFWLNAFENISFVQFVHRWLGVSAMLLILLYAGRAIFSLGRKEPVFMLLVLMAGTQVGLGIATLLTSVYLPLAVFHQMGAAVLVILMTVSLYRTRP
ncbi:MAG TPA: COX15/CtaA family protein, partial [Alphaproteobacteria bacterium]|nr:COX15/CtaA family protein [Alphaproteobacteria bacterium]